MANVQHSPQQHHVQVVTIKIPDIHPKCFSSRSCLLARGAVADKNSTRLPFNHYYQPAATSVVHLWKRI